MAEVYYRPQNFPICLCLILQQLIVFWPSFAAHPTHAPTPTPTAVQKSTSEPTEPSNLSFAHEERRSKLSVFKGYNSFSEHIQHRLTSSNQPLPKENVATSERPRQRPRKEDRTIIRSHEGSSSVGSARKQGSAALSRQYSSPRQLLPIKPQKISSDNDDSIYQMLQKIAQSLVERIYNGCAGSCCTSRKQRKGGNSKKTQRALN